MRYALPRTFGHTRALAAVVLAVTGVACAVAAAYGPADRERARYSWPSAQLPDESPTRTWVAPLFLARHMAASIDARVPCGPEKALDGAQSDGAVLALATSRDARRQRGLAVARRAQETTVTVGARQLARFSTRSLPSCFLDIHLDGLNWEVSHRGGRSYSGRLAAVPMVAGLLTELDLRAQPGLSVTVRPFAQDTRSSGRQTKLRIVALAALVAAVILLPWPSPRRPRWRRRPLRLAAQDCVVALTVGAWWILAPLYFDDGWVRARQTNFQSSGGFSNYYEPWGANLPMATWLEWLQHFAVGRSESLALHRLPTVLVLLVTWFAARACLTRIVGRGPSRSDATWWSAALTFALGAAAFGVTLRPEPAISLLAVAVLLCSLRWVERPSLWPALISVFLIGLAVPIHPTGAVAAAPLAIIAPALVRHARRSPRVGTLELVTVGLIGMAWLVLIAFLDADVSSHRTNLELLRDTKEHGAGLLDELDRYEGLSTVGGSAPRRLAVALMVLSGLAGLVGLAKRRRLAQHLPTVSVLLGLAIFAVAPSKWIWHFGALVSLTAVAVGAEANRLAAAKLRRVGRWWVVGGVLVVAVWAIRRPGIWGPLDTERLTALYVVRPYAASILLGFGALFVAARLHWVRRPYLAALPAVTGSVLLATTSLLALDAAGSGSWTAARQVLSLDRGGCGVASTMIVSVPTPLLPHASSRTPTTLDGDQAASLGGPMPRGWHGVPASPVGVFTTALRGTDVLRVTWGRRRRDGVTPLVSRRADLRQAFRGKAHSQFVAEDSFPRRPIAADSIRLELLGAKGLRSSAFVSAPVTYAQYPLSSLLSRPRSASLVSPFLFEAMPCARLPTLRYGVAQPPSLLVDFSPYTILGPTSLFHGIEQVLDVVRIPLEASSRRKYIYVYWVRPHPRDAVAPVRRVA